MAHRAAVLVVEDHIDLLSNLISVLEEEGMEVFGTGDGPSAMMMMRTGSPPDLVIVDLDLPYINGRDLISEMKRQPSLRHIPVVVLTGSGAEVDVPGADVVLGKPMDLRELLGALYGLLGGSGALGGHRKNAAAH